MSAENPTVVYRDIPGWPGYRAGSDGSIWSMWGCGHHGKMGGVWRELAQVPVNRWGHLVVTLYPGAKQFCVHRLILEAFIGPCPTGMEACHDPDPNPANNRIENLRWDTSKANKADMKRHGRFAGWAAKRAKERQAKAVVTHAGGDKPKEGADK